jgi:hypothetical protein
VLVRSPQQLVSPFHTFKLVFAMECCAEIASVSTPSPPDPSDDGRQLCAPTLGLAALDAATVCFVEVGVRPVDRPNPLAAES